MKCRIRSSILSVGIMFVCVLPAARAQQRIAINEQASVAASERARDWPAFFPLEVGNEWVYSDGAGRFTVQVLRQTLENNRKRYFEVSGYFPNDTVLVRKLRQGPFSRILEFNPAGEDFLWYDFESYWGAWRLEIRDDIPCIAGSLIRVGEVGAKVDVPAGVFERALRLDFTPRCMDAGIASEYFAGGVGLVKRVLNTIAGPRTLQLVSAHVGGSELPAASYGIEVSLDRPVFYNNLMPPIVDPWPTARPRLVVRNETAFPVEFSFPTSQRFDFILRDAPGREILRWSDGQAFAPVIGRETLVHESLTYSASIKLRTRDGKPLPAGFYTLAGYLTTSEFKSGLSNIAAAITFEVRDLH